MQRSRARLGAVLCRSRQRSIFWVSGASSPVEHSYQPRQRGPDRRRKIELLEQIREHGSISAAGRAMEMSYKRAWDLVDEINRICGRAAVEPQAGGKNGGGAMLTKFGATLVARYRRIER